MWGSCQAGFSTISSGSFNDLGQFFFSKGRTGNGLPAVFRWSIRPRSNWFRYRRCESAEAVWRNRCVFELIESAGEDVDFTGVESRPIVFPVYQLQRYRFLFSALFGLSAGQ